MKKLLLGLIIMIGLSSCFEAIHPNTTPFVVTTVTYKDHYCIYGANYYVTEIIDTCNKYKIGDTIKFTK